MKKNYLQPGMDVIYVSSEATLLTGSGFVLDIINEETDQVLAPPFNPNPTVIPGIPNNI